MGILRNKIQLLVVLGMLMLCSGCGTNAYIDSEDIARNAWSSFMTNNPDVIDLPDDASISFNESICSAEGDGIAVVSINTPDATYLYRLSFNYVDNELSNIEVIPYAAY